MSSHISPKKRKRESSEKQLAKGREKAARSQARSQARRVFRAARDNVIGLKVRKGPCVLTKPNANHLRTLAFAAFKLKELSNEGEFRKVVNKVGKLAQDCVITKDSQQEKKKLRKTAHSKNCDCDTVNPEFKKREARIAVKDAKVLGRKVTKFTTFLYDNRMTMHKRPRWLQIAAVAALGKR